MEADLQKCLPRIGCIDAENVDAAQQDLQRLAEHHSLVGTPSRPHSSPQHPGLCFAFRFLHTLNDRNHTSEQARAALPPVEPELGLVLDEGDVQDFVNRLPAPSDLDEGVSDLGKHAENPHEADSGKLEVVDKAVPERLQMISLSSQTTRRH